MKIKNFFLISIVMLICNFALSQVSAREMPPEMMGGRPFPGAAVSQKQQPQMITCPECGQQVPVGTKICPYCGADLSNVQPSAQGQGTEQGGQAQPAQPQIPKVTVVEGKLIISKITKEVLEEPEKKQILQTELGDNYYDDGTHGDVKAGDGIYTNVEIIKDKYISPLSNYYRKRLVELVNKAMNMDPLEFSGDFAAAISDFSELDNIDDLRIERDRILETFRAKILAPYKINPEDPYSRFYPVYFPPAPKPPSDVELQALVNAAANTGQRLMPGVQVVPSEAAEPRGVGQIAIQRAKNVATGAAAAAAAGVANEFGPIQQYR